MKEWTGPPDSYYDPPIEPEVETKECQGCGVEKEISVDSDYCGDCLQGMEDAAAEAKYDELKDEGRLR